MTNEREAFNEFAAANAGILFTGTITADQAPFYMAIWSAACRWQAARAALPASADQPPSQETLTDADIKRIHYTQACLPDLVAMKDQWPEILRFARAVIDADRKARQQEAENIGLLHSAREVLTALDSAYPREDAPLNHVRTLAEAALSSQDAAIAKGEQT